MRYALSLADDNRVLSVTYPQFTSGDAVTVDELPQGDISDYRYIDGEFVYDPLPIEEVSEAPTQLDFIEAQVTYTAMMTYTLLEV